jgi:hypothetical protein
MQNEQFDDEQIKQLKSSLGMFKFISIAFLVVVVLGTWLFHIIEKWDWLDSLYFVIVTIATVGYGNLVPATDVGKVVNIILIIIGIGIFGVFVNQLVKYQGLRRLEKINKHNEKDK